MSRDLQLQNILKKYQPRASAVPAKVDLTACPYMWPFCKQPLYATALPVRPLLSVIALFRLRALVSGIY